MSDQPPSYAQATGSSTASQHLQVPGARSDSIPPAQRRSMEDEARPLPEGWVRQYDHKSNHQYFVDTKASPLRSIWHHPYDDETYLKTLSSEERERIEEMARKPHSRDDIIAAESDPDDDHVQPQLPPRPSGKDSSDDKAEGSHKFGRKLKDKLTGTTHEQRVEERRIREEQEIEMYRRHMMLRNAMQQAFETGTPQLIGKDKTGRDVYIEPPRGGLFDQRSGVYGYNPYSQGPYQQNRNSRYIPYPTPTSAYNRPYYGGYGYGMGLPLMGGLVGGALLGGLMF